MAKKKETDDTSFGMVLYTDGGTRPGGRGIGGWGIHGYSFELKPAKLGKKENAPTDIGYLTVNSNEGNYSDDGWWVTERPVSHGSTPDGKLGARPGDTAKIINVCQYFDAWGSLIPESTNNIAELVAFKKSLDLVRDVKPKNVSYWMDSSYVLHGLTEWYPKWQQNNWVSNSGKPVQNEALWKEIIEGYESLRETINFSFNWTRGHNDDQGNEIADKNATRGIIAGRKGLELEEVQMSPVANYWNKKATANRLLAHPYWYFIVNQPTPMTDDGKTIYHIGAQGGTVQVLNGKRVSDHGFAVVMQKEPDPVLEVIRDLQNTSCNHSYEKIVTADLKKIFTPENYCDILSHGGTYLYSATHQNDLYDIKEDRYTEELATPYLMFRAIDQLSILEGILIDVLRGSDKYMTFDITSLFYTQETKGKKSATILSKDFKQSVKSIDAEVDVGEDGNCKMVKFTLNIGQDIANRNALNAIAEGEPKVTLVVEKETDTSYRYWTIVQVGDDASIWSSVFANQKIQLE